MSIHDFGIKQVEIPYYGPTIPELREYRLPDASFYMALTPEAYRAAMASSLGWRATRQLVEGAIGTALSDPFGESSIDHFKDTQAGQTERVVHGLSEAAEKAIGIPVAIKGTGVDPNRYRLGRRIGLKEQFTLMHQLSSAQRELQPDGIGGLVFINRPLGYISHEVDGRQQEWLLMERVVDGTPVDEVRMAPIGGGIAPGFSTEKYPDLAVFANPYKMRNRYYKPDNIFCRDLVQPVADALQVSEYKVGDLQGHNILQQTAEDGSHRYTLIDLQPR